LFSESPVALQGSGLRPFGTVLKIRASGATSDVGGRRFCGSSRIGESSYFQLAIPRLESSRPSQPVLRQETLRALPRSTTASGKGKSWSTWVSDTVALPCDRKQAGRTDDTHCIRVRLYTGKSQPDIGAAARPASAFGSHHGRLRAGKCCGSWVISECCAGWNGSGHWPASSITSHGRTARPPTIA
jgi:hypothetical protein